METITYRVADSRDIPEICRFRVTQLSRGGTVQVPDIMTELTAFFQTRYATDSIHQIFACCGDRIVATGAVLFYQYPPSHVNRSGQIAYISNMYTEPEYRNRGIASRILAMLEEEALRRGITSAKLGATPMGVSIYTRAGYHEDALCTLVKELSEQ